IIHVNNKVDPAGDIETIDIELCLADYDTVDKRYQKDSKLAKVNHSKELLALLPIYERLLAGLEQGQSARAIITDPEERALVYDLHLITLKPVIYVCNIDEGSIGTENDYVKTVKAIASSRGSSVITICGKTEAEIAAMDTPEERAEFLAAVGLEESGMNALIREAYSTLGLRTFFTAGPDEDRAWTFKAGSKAPQAAGVIHTDFEKGFIKAEVYNCEDLFKYGSEAKVKEAGKLRIEGKDYVVQDGDVMFFKFNV
ncbi:MAG: redox-regulated ATPase YchF, partial [Spirochaetales bacterium]|nr:redox-regulated ATPase YchF [Spirochaetales bacterium]